MFHPGLPAAGLASRAGPCEGILGSGAAPLCLLPPADVTAAAGEAFLLERCWSVRTGLWDSGNPAVRRTLFGLSPLLAEAVPGGLLELPGLGSFGCQSSC